MKVNFTFAKAWRNYNAGESAAFDEVAASAMASKKIGTISPIKADLSPVSKSPVKTIPKVQVTKSE